MTTQQPWALRVTLLASDTELETILERIGAAICSPDHPGPCTNPWSITSTPVDDLDIAERRTWQPSVDELIEQRHTEQQR